MMKSKTVFVCASMIILTELMKIALSITDVGSIYTIYPGCGDSLALEIASLWLLCKSEVKNKPALFFFSFVIYIAATVSIAALEIFGIVALAF